MVAQAPDEEPVPDDVPAVSYTHLAVYKRQDYIREDGSKEVGYNAKIVYDISETSAAGKVRAPETKTMRELVSALIDASPVPFVPVDDLEMPAYYDSKQQTIFIKTGLSEEQLFVSMAKEVSAAVFDFKHNESRRCV